MTTLRITSIIPVFPSSAKIAELLPTLTVKSVEQGGGNLIVITVAETVDAQGCAAIAAGLSRYILANLVTVEVGT